MTTIKATKGEFVNIINGLFSVQELKGKEFSLTVSKNIVILQKSLKELEEAGKPSEEFMKLASEVNQLANLNTEDSKEKINKLEEENKELVEARRTQMDKVKEMMEEEIEVKLNILKEDILPEEITAKQINNLIKIIK
tara:strand:+ start:608 stop:1021 length:414 start_codon:yes stop_codon:yes gene_type:complete